MAQSGYTPILIYASGTTGNTPSAANLTSSASGAELALNYFDGKLFYKDASGNVQVIATKAGANGDVVGPSSATDNALVRFDTTTGKLVQNSVGILSDAGVLTGLTGLTSSGNITFSALTSGRVPYASTGGLLVDSGNLLYSGTDLTVYGITVGRGAGAVATNTAVGASALAANTSGAYNAAFGTSALSLNQGGSFNTGLGWGALASSVSGAQNTAVGQNSLYNNTGDYNTAVGRSALLANTSGGNNTAIGREALISNTTASGNTAVGYSAAYSNTTGADIVAVGFQSGYSNTTGGDNVSVGVNSLYANTTGGSNTAIGKLALRYNTTASNNTAVGYQANYSNTTGTGNVMLGHQAGYFTTGGENTVIGLQAGYNQTTGTGNTYLGYGAGPNANTTSSSLNTLIGRAAGNVISTGSKNTIVGCFNGNQSGVDIRTLSNYIVLADGDGYPAFWGQGGDSGYMKLQAGRLEFPATQNASSNPNTLDDYETGTWTPTLGRGTTDPTITFGVQTGRYIKIGRQVTAIGTLTWTANSGGSGTWRISGLPFTIQNSTANIYPHMYSFDNEGFTYPAGRTSMGGYGIPGATAITLYCVGSAVAAGAVSAIANVGYIYFTIIYEAAN